jgi:ABC-2 type transport system permease protein
MVMLIRIPFEVPAWQIWVSLAILYLSFVGMTWVAAKIYRIGIFMHGKKPSIKDLYRWATYK